MECLLYPSECVICLQELDSKSNYHDRNQTSISYLEHSILKLLNLDVSALSITNSVNYGEEEKEALQLFCTKCFERNVEIHNLFAQIEALGQSLEGLKSSIEDQFRESEQALNERETHGRRNCNIKSESSIELKNLLRNEISRGFGLNTSNDLETYNDLPFDDNISGDDWEEPVEVENFTHHIPQKSTRESNKKNILQLSNRSEKSFASNNKMKYNVKELSVSLQRLPQSVIPNKKININLLPPSLVGKLIKGPFFCLFADCQATKEFHSQKARDHHMLSIHDIAPYELSSAGKAPQEIGRAASFNCMYKDCGAAFMTKLARYQHLRKKHAKQNFRKRVKQERGRPVFKCIFADCAFRGVFPSEDARDAHIKEEHSSFTEFHQIEENLEPEELEIVQPLDTFVPEEGPAKFKCVFADCEEFDTEEARDAHVKSAHPYFRELRTKYISKSVNSQKECSTEKPEKHKIIRRGFFCEEINCKRKHGFFTQAELDIHKRAIHEGIRKSYPCKYCGKLFARKNLWSHYQSKHLTTRKYICHYCGYRTYSKPNLNSHLNKHTDEKNYKCETCGKEFKTRAGKVVHVRYAHTGERPYRCDRCGKGFVTGGHLSKHFRSVHEKHIRPHICHICGKDFPIPGYLHMHISNSHSDASRSRKTSKKPKVSASNENYYIGEALRIGTANSPDNQNFHQGAAPEVYYNEPSSSNSADTNLSLNSSVSQMPVNLSNEERYPLHNNPMPMNFPVFNPGPLFTPNITTAPNPQGFRGNEAFIHFGQYR